MKIVLSLEEVRKMSIPESVRLLSFANSYGATFELDQEGMTIEDTIDNDTENYVRNLIAYSYDDVDIADDDIIVIAKDILELAVSALRDHGARFPYVDENY